MTSPSHLFTRSVVLACSATFACGAGFGPTRQILKTVSAPSALAGSDMDGDGIPDLVVIESGGNGVTVWKNDGHGVYQRDGEWQRPVNHTVAAGLADFDGDGHADILAHENLGDDREPDWRALLVRADGQGGFAPKAENLFAEGRHNSVEIHDLDGDGAPDLLTPAASWINDGHGHFTAHASEPLLPEMTDYYGISGGRCWVDEGGSGRDSFFFHDVPNHIYRAVNQGDGTFKVEETGLALTDDVFLAGAVMLPEISPSACLLAYNARNLQLYVKGPGGYALVSSLPVFPPGVVGGNIATAVRQDHGEQRIFLTFNGSDRYGRAVKSRVSELTVATGAKPRLSLKAAGTYAAPPVPPVLSDVDGDGIADLVLATAGVPDLAKSDDQLIWQRGTPAGAFRVKPAAITEPGFNSHRPTTLVYAGDLDGDGDVDLITTTQGSSVGSNSDPFVLTLWTNQGQGKAFTRKNLVTRLGSGEVLEVRRPQGQAGPALVFHCTVSTGLPGNLPRKTNTIVQITVTPAGRAVQRTLLQVTGEDWLTPDLVDGDGDGIKDVRTIDYASRQPVLHWYRGVSATAFRKSADNFGFPTLMASLVDVDWDGDQDDWLGYEWRINDPSRVGVSSAGTPTGMTYPVGDHTFTFGFIRPAGVDFDGDGHADYFVTAGTAGNFLTGPVHTVVARAGVPSANYPYPFSASVLPTGAATFPAGLPDGLSFVDVDSDAAPDAFYLRPDDRSLVWKRNLGGGYFDAGAIIAGPSSYDRNATLVADLDGDGIPDLISTVGLSVLGPAATRLEWNKGE